MSDFDNAMAVLSGNKIYSKKTFEDVVMSIVDDNGLTLILEDKDKEIYRHHYGKSEGIDDYELDIVTSGIAKDNRIFIGLSISEVDDDEDIPKYTEQYLIVSAERDSVTVHDTRGWSQSETNSWYEFDAEQESFIKHSVDM